MISWRRSSNRSSRLTRPLGPSKAYSFSTGSHGIRRRCAASASRARVTSFSCTSSRSRAVSHSCGVTIGGVSIVVSAFLSCSRTPVEVLLQGVQRAVLVAGQRGQKLLRDLHWRGAQPVADPPPLAGFGRHQARVGQQGQVLGDCLPCDRQPGSQVRGRGRAARGQRGQDGPASGSASAVKTCSATPSMSGWRSGRRSGTMEVAGQLAQLTRPALHMGVVGLAVGVLGRLGEPGLDHREPRATGPAARA